MSYWNISDPVVKLMLWFPILTGNYISGFYTCKVSPIAVIVTSSLSPLSLSLILSLPLSPIVEFASLWDTNQRERTHTTWEELELEL